jgi:alpha-glucosidase
MKRIILIIISIILTSSCSSRKNEISSPNKNIHLTFNVDDEGFMSYNIKVNDNIFIDNSQLGFEAKDGLNLKNSFDIIKTEFSSKDETWEQIWGENKVIRNHYNEMAVHLANIDSTFLIMRFRLFNDGVGFRYEYHVKDTDKIILTDELTTFNIKNKGVSWSIPASFETYELLYRTLPLNEVDNANTPFTFKTPRR